LINLLGNAVKFTERGEVRLTVRYAREMAVFEVGDTGPGIGADDLGRVFDPFMRSAAGTGATTGSGLGLTIAKMLTDLMGGEMTVDSQPAVGTVFRLKLFLPEVYGEAAPVPQADLGPCTGYVGVRRRILVVDNEEADRQLLVRWLQPLGFEVATAVHGEDALAQLQAGWRPDAVFMDLAMPGIDGWETLRRLRAMGLQPAPQCAVVSANAFDKGLDHDGGVAAEDFLVKPVRRADVLRWLERRLALQWLRGPVDAPQTPSPTTAAVAPPALPRDMLESLQELARLGYYRGFVKRLAVLQEAYPQWGAWIDRLRAMAREFRFEALAAELQVIPATEADDA